MKCVKCGREIGNIVTVEDSNETIMGTLCNQCYEKIKKVASKDLQCIKCNKSIDINDRYFEDINDNAICENCFNLKKIVKKDGSDNSISHGMSYFLYVVGILVMIIGIIFGWNNVNNNSGMNGSGNFFMASIFGGFIIGSLFLGLGKLVYGIEFYISKNK